VDFRCTDVSTTIDASLTMVMGDDMVKVVSWYDNEWGYRYYLWTLPRPIQNSLAAPFCSVVDCCHDDTSFR
jgi:glyceraldehyde-3-phosphate dehydrogenase/erythrose-4-phosphate dehydrogenase